MHDAHNPLVPMPVRFLKLWMLTAQSTLSTHGIVHSDHGNESDIVHLVLLVGVGSNHDDIEAAEGLAEELLEGAAHTDVKGGGNISPDNATLWKVHIDTSSVVTSLTMEITTPSMFLCVTLFGRALSGDL